jgi:hypothetical protein
VILLFVLGVSLLVVMAAVAIQVANDVVHEILADNQAHGRQSWVKPQGRHRYIH